MPSHNSDWFKMSAAECTASASMTDEPVTPYAPSFVKKMSVLALTATFTARIARASFRASRSEPRDAPKRRSRSSAYSSGLVVVARVAFVFCHARLVHRIRPSPPSPPSPPPCLLGARGELRGGEPERRAGVEGTDAHARSARRRRRRRSRRGSTSSVGRWKRYREARATAPRDGSRWRVPRRARRRSNARARAGEPRGREARARWRRARRSAEPRAFLSCWRGSPDGAVEPTGALWDPHPPRTTRDANPGPGRTSGGRGTREEDPGPGNAPGGALLATRKSADVSKLSPFFFHAPAKSTTSWRRK